MKPRSAQERIPYRRGPQDEAALAQLHKLRSRWVPRLASDNLWLRFSLHVLGELWQTAGYRALPLQLDASDGSTRKLAVFTVVVSLVALQIVYVLQRFEHTFLEEVDDRLEEGLGDLKVVLGTDHLEEWIAETAGEHRREDEYFVEVRDHDDRVVAKSSNVPASGFPGALGVSATGTRYWDFPHPRSRSGARHVRALETWISGYHVCVGISLEEVQRAGMLPHLAQ